ncbi:General secretion pathway protein C [Minicystis rosea]|nr:General secretion pathway protein C [Minicystis rosea]
MGLDANLKRFFPAILCAMIAAIAYFQAVGIGQLVSAAIIDGAPVSPGAHIAKRRTPEANTDHATSAGAILARNPFDSVTGPLYETEQKAGEPEGMAQVERDPYADPPCAGARALLIASSNDADWSFAALVGSDGKTVLRRRGEELDGQKIFFVGDLRPKGERDEGGLWDRVWLTSATGRCQLALGAKPTGMKAPVAQAPQQSSSSMNGKIRQVGEHQFEVDRSMVESTLANPGELMKTRIFPVREGERVVGMRMMGIRPGTLLGSLGMQNGDVLTSINGFEMNDPQKMLEAYTKLMRADKLSATVMRGGRPVNIEFNIK